MVLVLIGLTVVLSISPAHTSMREELLTSRYNVERQVSALDLDITQKAEDTGILGACIIVTAFNLLAISADVIGVEGTIRVVIVTVMLCFTSEGSCGDGSGEEENSERLDGDHFD